MESEKAKIVLGGKDYPVAALSLDNLQLAVRALDLLSKASTSGDLPGMLTASRSIIGAALDLSDEEAGKLPATLPEILDAIPVINRVSGLTELKNRRAAATA